MYLSLKKIKFSSKLYLILFFFIYLLVNFHKTNLVFAMQNNNSNYIVEKDFLSKMFFLDEASSSSFNNNNDEYKISLDLSLNLPNSDLGSNLELCSEFFKQNMNKLPLEEKKITNKTELTREERNRINRNNYKKRHPDRVKISNDNYYLRNSKKDFKNKNK
ncbi:hypothetical protein M33023_p00020 (plasmid) [Candidatus Phytoplasma asteris]|uniref:Sequence-variable mosaic (SVM) signal sequence domain-containing protein n=1 Tax=Candidatus Phytoplasma asteris TaxID=85620 RepID=A0ABZ2YIL4_9MOLU